MALNCTTEWLRLAGTSTLLKQSHPEQGAQDHEFFLKAAEVRLTYDCAMNL